MPGELYRSYCPKCRFTCYTDKATPKGILKFRCSCKTEWRMPKEHAKRMDYKMGVS